MITFAGNHNKEHGESRVQIDIVIWIIYGLICCLVSGLDTGSNTTQTQIDGSPRRVFCFSQGRLLAGEIWIFVVKLLRVHGGCLGIRRR